MQLMSIDWARTFCNEIKIMNIKSFFAHRKYEKNNLSSRISFHASEIWSERARERKTTCRLLCNTFVQLHNFISLVTNWNCWLNAKSFSRCISKWVTGSAFKPRAFHADENSSSKALQCTPDERFHGWLPPSTIHISIHLFSLRCNFFFLSFSHSSFDPIPILLMRCRLTHYKFNALTNTQLSGVWLANVLHSSLSSRRWRE